MKGRDALRQLSDVSASQWGLVTSAQATARGVTRLDLSRLTESGDLVRLAHGVYKDAGAPSGTYLDLRAAWLSSEPARLAHDRLNDGHRGIVVSGQSAAWLHDIGNLRSNRTELTTPVRRQTQKADLHYRLRQLTTEDVTIREGLPVTTPERTIADLVDDRTDLSIVADALRDASRKSEIDLERLSDILAPLAERNGHKKNDGGALLDQLRTIAGIDSETIAQEILSLKGISALVMRNVVLNVPHIDFSSLVDTSELQRSIAAIFESNTAQTEALRTSLPLIAPKFPTSTLNKLATSVWAKEISTSLSAQTQALDWVRLARSAQALERARSIPPEVDT